MVSKYILYVTFLNQPELIFFKFKSFHIFLSNTYNSINNYVFICSPLNVVKSSDVLLTIILNISHLFTPS